MKQGGKKLKEGGKTPAGVSELKQNNLRWVSVSRADPQTAAWLKNQFGFQDTDVRDILPPIQRPKILDRGDYIFMILLFPVYDRKSGEVRPSEVDFFIGKNFLVTVNTINELEQIENLFTSCSRDPDSRSLCFNSTPATLLHEILNRLLQDASRMLVHVSQDIDAIENKIFTEFEKGAIWKLLRIKTNIVNFRRSMQSHTLVINRLLQITPKFFPADKLKDYFQNLREMIEEIWDLLENYKDTVDALHETNVSLIDFRINEIMKTLTIFSVIVFPLTLFASVFGMNLQGMPLTELPYGFWVAIGIMISAALGMLWFFEKKRWL